MTRSTYQQHAQVMRKVKNMDADGTRNIPCCFSDCDRDGYENHKRVQHEHLPAFQVDGTTGRGDAMCAAVDAGAAPGLHRHYVYCSERHMNMDHFGMGPQGLAMQESRGGMYGYLPTGYRGGIL